MFAQLIRFALVGLSGSFINLAVFWLAVSKCGTGHNFGAVVAFVVAVTSNFSLNRAWSFRVAASQRVAFRRGWVKYFAVNLLGLVIGLLVLNVVVVNMGSEYVFHGQAFGVVCGMLFNFFLSRGLVFLAMTEQEV